MSMNNTTSSRFSIDVDNIVTEINGIKGQLANLNENILNPENFYSGKVSLKDTRTTTGEWEITGLIIGKPLIFVHDSTTSYNAGVYLKVVSGAVGGANSTSDSQGAYQMGRNSNMITGNVFIAIPTNTTVVINIHTGSPTGFTVYAYQ